NVVATGDIVSTGMRYPNIDYANGGGINGIIAAVETYMKIGDDQTKYVPGHGVLMMKPALAEYHDMLVSAADKVGAVIKAGKSEDDAGAAKALAEIGAKLKTMQMADDNMVKLIYRSLKGAKANPA